MGFHIHVYTKTVELHGLVYGVLQQYFSYIIVVSFLVEETGVPGEIHRSVASH